MSKCGKVNPPPHTLLCPWLNLELKMHVILNFRSLERAVNKYEIECLLKCCSSDVNRMETLTFLWPWWASEGWAGDRGRPPPESNPVVHTGENKEGCSDTSQNTEREAESEGSWCDGLRLDNQENLSPLNFLLRDANKSSEEEVRRLVKPAPAGRSGLEHRAFPRVD